MCVCVYIYIYILVFLVLLKCLTFSEELIGKMEHGSPLGFFVGLIFQQIIHIWDCRNNFFQVDEGAAYSRSPSYFVGDKSNPQKVLCNDWWTNVSTHVGFKLRIGGLKNPYKDFATYNFETCIFQSFPLPSVYPSQMVSEGHNLKYNFISLLIFDIYYHEVYENFDLGLLFLWF